MQERKPKRDRTKKRFTGLLRKSTQNQGYRLLIHQTVSVSRLPSNTTALSRPERAFACYPRLSRPIPRFFRGLNMTIVKGHMQCL